MIKPMHNSFHKKNFKVRCLCLEKFHVKSSFKIKENGFRYKNN